MNTLTKKMNRNRPVPRFGSMDPFFSNDLFDFWGNDKLVSTVPSINITEDEKSYKVDMAAPGMKKEDFNIDVDDNMITISSEKESENQGDESDKRYAFREYNYSSFSRSFTVPDNAETEKISASYKDGILCLSIPKKETQLKNKSRKIRID